MNINTSRLFSELKLFLGRLSLPGGLRIWITLGSFCFVLFSLISNASAIISLPLSNTSFVWLLFGVVINLVSLFVNAFAWKTLISWLGHKPRDLNLISLYIKSNLLKYLPGGIWHFIDRLRVLKIYMEPGKALASVFLEPMLMVVAASLLVPFGNWDQITSIFFLFPLFILSAPIREPLLTRLEMLKVNDITRLDLDLSKSFSFEKLGTSRNGYPWRPLLIEIIFLIIRFYGFYCCLIAFSLESSVSLGNWLSAFSFAWILGFVVPGAPGGLGVFETSLILKMGSLTPEASLIGAVLGYRIIATMSDLLGAFLVTNQITLKKLLFP